MPEKLKWSGVCVHCRARISGQLDFAVKYPASFRESCGSCGGRLLIVLLPEGAMVAVGPV